LVFEFGKATCVKKVLLLVLITSFILTPLHADETNGKPSSKVAGISVSNPGATIGFCLAMVLGWTLPIAGGVYAAFPQARGAVRVGLAINLLVSAGAAGRYLVQPFWRTRKINGPALAVAEDVALLPEEIRNQLIHGGEVYDLVDVLRQLKDGFEDYKLRRILKTFLKTNPAWMDRFEPHIQQLVDALNKLKFDRSIEVARRVPISAEQLEFARRSAEEAVESVPVDLSSEDREALSYRVENLMRPRLPYISFLGIVGYAEGARARLRQYAEEPG
jgi:hypothetical protein